jgi:hypothetical protein
LGLDSLALGKHRALYNRKLSDLALQWTRQKHRIAELARQGSKMTALDNFTRVTVTVIQEDGLDGYLPTVMLPATRDIRAIEGIPEGVDHRDAIQNYILRQGFHKGEFLFGVQTGKKEITTGHFTTNGTSFMKILETESGYVITPLTSCDWWRIEP